MCLTKTKKKKLISICHMLFGALKNTHSSSLKMCSEFILNDPTISFYISHPQLLYCFTISTSLR